MLLILSTPASMQNAHNLLLLTTIIITSMTRINNLSSFHPLQ